MLEVALKYKLLHHLIAHHINKQKAKKKTNERGVIYHIFLLRFSLHFN